MWHIATATAKCAYERADGLSTWAVGFSADATTHIVAATKAAAAHAILPPTFSQAHQFVPLFIAARNGDSLRMLRLRYFGQTGEERKQR